MHNHRTWQEFRRASDRPISSDVGAQRKRTGSRQGSAKSEFEGGWKGRSTATQEIERRETIFGLRQDERGKEIMGEGKKTKSAQRNAWWELLASSAAKQGMPYRVIACGRKNTRSGQP